ncbi:MAG: AtpZ/AtpI family protein [Tissierellales bacterium]|jgi:ATP synthase protein I|nr:AtpZ/AtpI family protein [Tissierellales bacterium]MBN2828555.1 AtpZ/AtpI family protein [Tissierellales bacterium]
MNHKRTKILENLALVTQIGIVMIVPIMIGLFLGKFLDEKLGTGNIFLLIFIIAGVGSAFLNVYKIAMRDYKKK